MRAFTLQAAALTMLLLLSACGSAEEKERLGGPPTAALLYQKIDSGKDLEPLGKVDLIVTTRQPNESRAVKLIHRHGAKAFRYVQTYWSPAGKPYDGLDIAIASDLAYCSAGDDPLLGRRQDGREWYFLDANEKGLRAWFSGLLRDLSAHGYDGVMFDRGFAALTGIDAVPAKIWNRPSTCTDRPHSDGATFADAYVDLMRLVRSHGLMLIQNYGHSPFDPMYAFRPDPSDPGCAESINSDACGRTRSGMEAVNYFLNEAVAHPRDKNWAADFVANQAGETDEKFGGKVIGLITQGTLERSTSRKDVVFQYARVRLFDLPVAVFTGYDKCHGRTRLCNRLGAYPELATARWGSPIGRQPIAAKCEANSESRCLWVRQYERGLVAVNITDRDLKVRVPLRKDLCGSLRDLSTGATYPEACRRSFTFDTPAWSGTLMHLAEK